MFTGLVQGVGTVTEVTGSDEGRTLTVSLPPELADFLGLGASIALDGVCTTVVSQDGPTIRIEASPETLACTTMGDYAPGRTVNLERPLSLGDPLGGHLVTGHVDGVGRVVSIQSLGNSWVFRFRVEDAALVPLLVEKGSVAVSGVSLTVNTVVQDIFSVAIIPHTFRHTTFGTLRADDPVNLETDLLGKYVQRLLTVGRIPPAYEQHAKAAAGRIHTGDWFNHQH